MPGLGGPRASGSSGAGMTLPLTSCEYFNSYWIKKDCQVFFIIMPVKAKGIDGNKRYCSTSCDGTGHAIVWGFGGLEPHQSMSSNAGIFYSRGRRVGLLTISLQNTFRKSNIPFDRSAFLHGGRQPTPHFVCAGRPHSLLVTLRLILHAYLQLVLW